MVLGKVSGWPFARGVLAVLAAISPSSTHSCSLESSPTLAGRIGLVTVDCSRRIMVDIRDVMVSRPVESPKRVMSSCGVSRREISSSSLTEPWLVSSDRTAGPLRLGAGGPGMLGTISSAASAALSGLVTSWGMPSPLPNGGELPTPSTVTLAAAPCLPRSSGRSGCAAAACTPTRMLLSLLVMSCKLEEIASAIQASRPASSP